jgi:hypothetical protein
VEGADAVILAVAHGGEAPAATEDPESSGDRGTRRQDAAGSPTAAAAWQKT